MVADPQSVVCRACRRSYPILIARDEPIVTAACPNCGEHNYASRYERIDIGLTEVCNLSCNMCRRPQEREFMADEKVERLLSEAEAIGVKTISFSGGEPFAHPSFRKFLGAALNHRLDVELVTNGTLVKPSDIPALEQLKCVTVSLDGPQPVHDFIRGKQGAWEKTMATLRLLAGSSATWGTNTVIQARNAYHVLDTWRAIVSAGRPSYVAFTHVEVIPETANLQPSPAANEEIKRQLETIRDECKARGVHFNDEAMVTALYDLFADKSRRYRPRSGCSIPATFIGVSQYGFFPCWHQGRAVQAEGLIEALQSELCRDILREGLERRCVGCNAANYSWSTEWVEGIAAAHAAKDWSEGVVYLSASERETGSLSPGRRTIPLLERLDHDT